MYSQGQVEALMRAKEFQAGSMLVFSLSLQSLHHTYMYYSKSEVVSSEGTCNSSLFFPCLLQTVIAC